MSNKLGFIGCGKMAKAIIKGILNAEYINNNDIMASTNSPEESQKASEELNIQVITDNKKIVEFADIIFIATKPYQVEPVLTEIKDTLTDEKLIVSIAAGVKTTKIEAITNKTPVIRVMPNTPALVQEGMSATTKGSFATDKQEKLVQEILSKVGKVISVEEKQIDIVTAISGSGPAFFYQIFEDMAQAGVKLGLDYEKSLLLAVQTAIGSAKMTIHRDKPLTELIANVATKGGCTEVGINTMHELNSDKFFEEIISKTTKKAHDLG